MERHFTLNDLRDLFTLNEATNSDTHDQYKCRKCSRDGSYSLVSHVDDSVKGIIGDLAQWDHFPQTKHLKVRWHRWDTASWGKY